LVGKFLRTWGEREKQKAQFSSISSATPSNIKKEQSSLVALNLSRRLTNGTKVKSILHIEAGIEMLALGLLISSEVYFNDFFFVPLIYLFFIKNDGMFPETAGNVPAVVNKFVSVYYYYL
jgi:hypothetical protein